jgi:hypothetical protein
LLGLSFLGPLVICILFSITGNLFSGTMNLIHTISSLEAFPWSFWIHSTANEVPACSVAPVLLCPWPFSLQLHSLLHTVSCFPLFQQSVLCWKPHWSLD